MRSIFFWKVLVVGNGYAIKLSGVPLRDEGIQGTIGVITEDNVGLPYNLPITLLSASRAINSTKEPDLIANFSA